MNNVIKKITGEGLVTLKKPTLPLIEFIGNSITCGAAADASAEAEKIPFEPDR